MLPETSGKTGCCVEIYKCAGPFVWYATKILIFKNITQICICYLECMYDHCLYGYSISVNDWEIVFQAILFTCIMIFYSFYPRNIINF